MTWRSPVRSSSARPPLTACQRNNKGSPGRARPSVSDRGMLFAQPRAAICRSTASRCWRHKAAPMAASEPVPLPEVVTEAIVVIDLVESTLTSNLFGWYAVGRHSLRDLRGLIGEVGLSRGLRCLKSTGDGYLLTFRDAQSAELAAIRAVEAVFDLL